MSAATKLPAPRLPWPRGRRKTPYERREVERLVHGKAPTLREMIGELAPSLPVGTGRLLDALLDRIEKLEKVAHAPYDFSELIERIEALEAKVRP